MYPNKVLLKTSVVLSPTHPLPWPAGFLTQVNVLVINLLVDRRLEKREKQLKWTALFWVNSSGPGGGSPVTWLHPGKAVT